MRTTTLSLVAPFAACLSSACGGGQAAPKAVAPQAAVKNPVVAGDHGLRAIDRQPRISKKAALQTNPAYASCQPKNAKQVSEFAGSCERTTGLAAEGAPLPGSQADQDPPQSFPLSARANRCYRVYIDVASGIQTADVAIRDSEGNVVASDAVGPGVSATPHDGAVCFRESDAASITLGVGRGKGDFRILVFAK